MGSWSQPTSAALGWRLLSLIVINLILMTSHVHPAAIRSRRDSVDSLTLALSDLHNDIYSGSNKEDGDGHNGNSIDKMSPDPAPAPAPDPAPVPDPVPVPDPAPAPDPAQPDPPSASNPDPPQAGPDFSNTEDDDGHGNNGGPDIPSVDHPGQQQQQQEEQQQQQQQEDQQQQQQQAGPTTLEPPTVPDTPEPLPPGEITVNKKSNAADHAPDTGSSEEKTGSPTKNGGADPLGASMGSPDGFGGSFGAPDPFDPFGKSNKLGPLVPNYVDPFDPFMHAAAGPPPPPPPPQAPPPQAPSFSGSINMGVNVAGPPPPPPPPAVIVGGHIPLPPPHPPGISSFDPLASKPMKSPPPPPSPPKDKENPRPNVAGEKAPVEKPSAAEAKALAIDKQNDLRDLRLEKLSERLSRKQDKVREPAPPPPPPKEKPESPQGPSRAELKSLARDKAQDLLDMHDDKLAMAKERQPFRRG